jgi:hypothetical protein
MSQSLLKLAEQLNTTLAHATYEEITRALPALHAVEARIKGLVLPRPQQRRTLASDLHEDR